MGSSSFGTHFKIHSFGESHGPAIGVIVDGCPSGLSWDQDLLNKNLQRRRPGGFLTSPRKEPDSVEILSGVYQGKTLGTPICMMVKNVDARPQDYKVIEAAGRTGHADHVWKKKFSHTDPRGGGRSSGRETVARVLAGSVAQMLVTNISPNTQVIGFSEKVGSYSLSPEEIDSAPEQKVDDFPARFPSVRSRDLAMDLERFIQNGDSMGGLIRLVVKNPPANLGQPVFHKLKADLASAMMSLGAVSSVELGAMDFSMSGINFHNEIKRKQYGGIQGGISTGEDIILRCGVKPTSTLGENAKRGRHDPYIGTRAIVVMESMIYLVLADHLLWMRSDRV